MMPHTLELPSSLIRQTVCYGVIWNDRGHTRRQIFADDKDAMTMFETNCHLPNVRWMGVYTLMTQDCPFKAMIKAMEPRGITWDRVQEMTKRGPIRNIDIQAQFPCNGQ